MKPGDEYSNIKHQTGNNLVGTLGQQFPRWRWKFRCIIIDRQESRQSGVLNNSNKLAANRMVMFLWQTLLDGAMERVADKCKSSIEYPSLNVLPTNKINFCISQELAPRVKERPVESGYIVNPKNKILFNVENFNQVRSSIISEKQSGLVAGKRVCSVSSAVNFKDILCYYDHPLQS